MRSVRRVLPLSAGAFAALVVVFVLWFLFPGFSISPAAANKGNGLAIEFYGDSITKGIRVYCAQTIPACCDERKSFEYLVGQNLHAQTRNFGVGGQGIVHRNAVNPTAKEYFLGVHSAIAPDIVVVNEGTNDRGARWIWMWPERFWPAYWNYIKTIRATYPHATIFCMRPFNGAHESAIKHVVRWLDDPKIIYVDTTGWIEPSDMTDGLHPNVSGQNKIAEKLTPIVSADFRR